MHIWSSEHSPQTSSRPLRAIPTEPHGTCAYSHQYQASGPILPLPCPLCYRLHFSYNSRGGFHVWTPCLQRFLSQHHHCALTAHQWACVIIIAVYLHPHLPDRLWTLARACQLGASLKPRTGPRAQQILNNSKTTASDTRSLCQSRFGRKEFCWITFVCKWNQVMAHNKVLQDSHQSDKGLFSWIPQIHK